jgi:hypothetical protein
MKTLPVLEANMREKVNLTKKEERSSGEVFPCSQFDCRGPACVNCWFRVITMFEY